MLQSYVPSMNKQSIKIVEEIKSELARNRSNLVENTTHIISDRIMAMLLETVIDCNDGDIDPQFTKMAEKGDGMMCDRLIKPWNLVPWIYYWFGNGKEYYEMTNFLHGECRKLVEKRISKMKQKNSDPNANESVRPALIDALVNDHERNPRETSVQDIIDELFTFLAAGWDTTTWTASFTLLMLGLYPEIQEKVFEEVRAVVNKMEELTMAETMKMKYLECVINESMRLYPLVTLHGRRAESDIHVEIDGQDVIIPRRTQIVIDSEMLHRNPRDWTDPDRFIPERFLPENSKDRDPYSFIPFSGGPRNCIGKAFGMMEDKVIIAHIVHSFKVRSIDHVDKIMMNTQGIARRTYRPLRFEFFPRDN